MDKNLIIGIIALLVVLAFLGGVAWSVFKLLQFIIRKVRGVNSMAHSTLPPQKFSVTNTPSKSKIETENATMSETDKIIEAPTVIPKEKEVVAQVPNPIISYNGNKITVAVNTSTGSPVVYATEEELMEELESWMVLEEKHFVRDWLRDKKGDGVFLPSKVYARAMAFLDGRKWLSAEEFEEKQAREEERRKEEDEKYELAKSLILQQIDILLDNNLDEREMQEEIAKLQQPYKRKRKLIATVNERSYWEAMAIIMNHSEIPTEVAQEARKSRQKTMRAFTQRKINEYPMLDVKRFALDTGLSLSSKDAEVLHLGYNAIKI